MPGVHVLRAINKIIDMKKFNIIVNLIAGICLLVVASLAILKLLQAKDDIDLCLLLFCGLSTLFGGFAFIGEGLERLNKK